MDRFTLTRVRLFDDDANAALSAYIYGGIYAPPQIPKGIGRGQVIEYILDHLHKDDSPSAFAAVLQIMRFYELVEIGNEVVSRSHDRLVDGDDVRRVCYVTQIGAEFGKGDLPERADQYLDTDVVSSPAAAQAFDTLLETRVALAPLGSFDRLAVRINTEFKRREADVEDEPTLMAYDQIAAIVNNDLPRAISAVGRKAQILALSGEERHRALIKIYLGLDDISDAASEMWAGRLLRNQVIADDRRVIGLLGENLEPFESLDDVSPADCFVYERVANAMAYLGGKLTAAQVDLVSRIEAPAVHFLSDEPVGWLERRLAAIPQA
jgi:hypothetical protein